MRVLFSSGAILIVAILLTACNGATSARQIPPTAPKSTTILPTSPPPTDTTRPPAPTTTTASASAPTATLAPTPSPTDTTAPTAPALSSAQKALLARYPAKGAAPAVENDVWLNSPPLAWESLAGKVVIVEFWTYG